MGKRKAATPAEEEEILDLVLHSARHALKEFHTKREAGAAPDELVVLVVAAFSAAQQTADELAGELDVMVRVNVPHIVATALRFGAEHDLPDPHPYANDSEPFLYFAQAVVALGSLANAKAALADPLELFYPEQGRSLLALHQLDRDYSGANETSF